MPRQPNSAHTKPSAEGSSKGITKPATRRGVRKMAVLRTTTSTLTAPIYHTCKRCDKPHPGPRFFVNGIQFCPKYDGEQAAREIVDANT